VVVRFTPVAHMVVITVGVTLAIVPICVQVPPTAVTAEADAVPAVERTAIIMIPVYPTPQVDPKVHVRAVVPVAVCPEDASKAIAAFVPCPDVTGIAVVSVVVVTSTAIPFHGVPALRFNAHVTDDGLVTVLSINPIKLVLLLRRLPVAAEPIVGTPSVPNIAIIQLFDLVVVRLIVIGVVDDDWDAVTLPPVSTEPIPKYCPQKA
jgi:hypothetical protein